VKTIIALVLGLVVAVHPAAAQTADSANLWRSFAEKLEVGTVVKVRLLEGRSFNATVLEARPDALVLQPRTRVVVPVQPVRYDQIASLERERKGGGIGAGKAAAIGVATGVGAFFATLLIFLAVAMD
jgi:hypothetical protein